MVEAEAGANQNGLSGRVTNAMSSLEKAKGKQGKQAKQSGNNPQANLWSKNPKGFSIEDGCLPSFHVFITSNVAPSFSLARDEATLKHRPTFAQ